METLRLEPTSVTPRVILDAENSIFEFSERSLPENVLAFYQPILDWFDDYVLNPNPITNFVVRMVYLNTASLKIMYDILNKLENISRAGHEVTISWYYREDDEDMMETGEELAEMNDLSFQLISYPKN